MASSEEPMTNVPGLQVDSEEMARCVRISCVKMVHAASSSHLGGSLSVADILAVLYSRILRFDASNPRWNDRDRLFYSKGHACTALYAVLKEVGFLNAVDLESFSKNGSSLTTHINHKVPGVELSTGSLGHALPVGCGVALAGKRKGQSWRVFVVLSDGELDEGSNWEGMLFAAQHKLDNLTIIVDYNKIQSFGNVKEVLNLEPLVEKLRSFGMSCREIDGHDHRQLFESLGALPAEQGKPTAIVAHTVKGRGVDFMENRLLWHYKTPTKEQLDQALKQLGARP
jgi:transketolase